MRRRFLAFARWVDRLALRSCYLAIATMTVLVLAQIVMRYVLSQPFIWVEEASIFLMIWMAFVGAGVALRNNAHIAMFLVVDRLPVKLARMLLTFASLLVIAFACVVFWQGLLFMWSISNQQSAALGVPMEWPYAIVPLGAIIIIIEGLATMIESHPSASDHGSGAVL